MQICLALVVEESLGSGWSKRSQMQDSSDLPGTDAAWAACETQLSPAPCLAQLPAWLQEISQLCPMQGFQTHRNLRAPWESCTQALSIRKPYLKAEPSGELL